MTLTMKRILILFSVCLNLGFLAAAAHHAMTDAPPPGPRRLLTQALDGLEISGEQHQAMLALEDRLHANMRQWREMTLAIKADNVQAMTLADGPDMERLAANMEAEVREMRQRNLQSQDIFLQALDVLGPDKLRALGEAMIAAIRNRHKDR